MSDSQKPSPSNGYLAFLLIMTILLTASTVTLIVLLYVWHFSGFQGTSPITITLCNQPYFQFKYAELDLNSKIVFGMACIACFCSVIVLVSVSSWVVRNCQRNVQWSSCAKNFASFMTSVAVVACVTPCGHYLTLMMELPQCTVTKDDTQLIVLTLMAGVSLIAAVSVWAVLLCGKNKADDRQQRYREKQQEKRESKGQRMEQNLERLRPLIFDERQQTRQDIMGRRSFRNSRVSYENQPIPVTFSTYQPRQDKQTKPRFVPRPFNDNPITNLHPYLADNKQDPYRRLTDQKKVKFRQYEEDDQRYLTQERKKHYRDYDARPILRREGRGYQERRYNRGRLREQDYYQYDDYDENRQRRRPASRGQYRGEDDYEERDYPRRNYFRSRSRSPPRRQQFQQPPRYYEQPPRRYKGNPSRYDRQLPSYQRARPSYAKEHRY